MMSLHSFSFNFFLNVKNDVSHALKVLLLRPPESGLNDTGL